LTVAELSAEGLRAKIVPLPPEIADEQSANARFLRDAGAAVLMPQAELLAAGMPLAGVLGALTRDDALRMASAAYGVGRRDAADRVADACIAVAR
jgi:UDP-N-acetylglucosamine--N-acetylmuramyl-(pentapeptide) pyrophosphoryl-undecaprenol N-acetylglucosamine transferase